jgi:hypothetical protein
MWLSSTLRAGGRPSHVPWRNAEEMYSTIDQIQQGSVPWNTIKFRYQMPTMSTSPQWMQQTYELCYHNVRLLLQTQLANPAFKNHFDYAAYQEFNSNGDCVFSNFMSGEWAWNQSVCTFSRLHDIMLTYLESHL